MTQKFLYSCGCSFEKLDSGSDDSSMRLAFDPKIEKLNLECERTWDLISDGNTKGCFQLESRLGRSIAKKLKPSNIEELSALISILRPGCLEAIRDGKSVTNHYIDKKNGLESIDYFHPSLEPILKSTYGEMIYQEQAMEIAKSIAGFNLQEADMLRKAIGKKKPEEMAKVKLKFIDGAKELKIVSEDVAEQIFGWIEKSQRYSFNKSHAVSYAINAYLSAYTKAHFPKIFFSSYLRFAKDKIDPKAEIKELIQNANEMDIDVAIPDVKNLNEYFILKNNKIYFGLTDIKGFGGSVYKKLLSIVKTKDLKLDQLNWIQFAFLVLTDINSIGAKALIQSGAISYLKKSRNSMLFELNLINELTKKEIGTILCNIYLYDNFLQAINGLVSVGKLNKNRLAIIQNLINAYKKPPYSLEDNPEWISDTEEEILGCAITCSKVDMYDISMTNTTCKEFKTNMTRDNIILCGEVDNISVTKTKNGKNPGLEMAFVTLTDNSGVLDSVVFFPEQYRSYRNILFQNNVIIVKGNRSKSGDSLVVEKAYIAQS
jgi:DNA polymerase-3 subunit alpha